MKKYIGLYIGLNKIKKVKASKRLTYLKNEVLSIEYDNGKTEERPAAIVDRIATKESYSLTELRARISKVVVEKFLSTLLETEVKIEDVEFMLTLVSTSLNRNLDEATEVLWKKSISDRTVADIQVIFDNNKKEDAK